MKKTSLTKLFVVMITCLFLISFSNKSNAQLVANFTIFGSNIICINTNVQFYDASTGNNNIISWNWTFNGATPASSTLQNPTVTYLQPGTYDVKLKVTDSLGNMDSITIVGYITVDFVFVTQGINNPTCGSINGSINTTAFGGFPPYLYNWSNGASTPNISNLAPGTYNLFVMDSYGCMNQTTITLVNSNSLVSFLESHTNANCGNSDGAIDITPQAGILPFSFEWSTGDTTEDLNNLSAGIYGFTISDTLGCSSSADIIISNINGPSSTSSILNETCGNSNGSIDVSVTGGAPPYTYLWNTGATSEDLSNLSAGNYTLTITDNNLCIGNISVQLLDSNVLNITNAISNPSCGNYGDIEINVSGGTQPYTYLWSNGSTESSLINVQAGNYVVTVSETSGCSFEQIVQGSFYSYTYLSSTTANCGNNGTMTATTYSGNPPYNYSWSNGSTDQTISGLAAGFYTVTVTDNAGCVTNGQGTIATSCFNIIEGNVFNDLDTDCIQDSGEISMQGVIVTANNGAGLNYYGNTDANGNYKINIPVAGNFTLSASQYTLICGNFSVCTATGNVFFASVGDTSIENNFAFNSANASFDLRMHPGWTSANPGFDKQYWILYYNPSPIPFTDTATIVFTYDTSLTYLYSLPPLPLHDAVNHTLTWEVTNVPSPIFNWYDRLISFFNVPATTTINYLLQSTFYITPTQDDCNPANNHLEYSELVTGALDPNSKEVTPEGLIQEDDSVLTYTINFQNTGNDTTNFVILKDTLSEYLDPTTVENLVSSHEYISFEISGTGILTWLFNPILLVDSATNEPESKGFVKFRINKKPNLPLGTVIENKASIYFDYNPPIVTNTITNTLYNSVRNINDKNILVNAYPNPFTESTTISIEGINSNYDFKLNNVLGMKLREVNNINSKSFVLNRNDLPAGIYFYVISVDDKIMAKGKIVID